MIATLSGTVSEKLAELVVLDIRGVGYGLLVNAEDYGKLETGQSAKLYVYEYIRESAHDLYGFIELETKALFELLLGVNGVGPKMGLSILSIGSVAQVRGAIAGGDTKFIQGASGVGKRVAERVVVDLKDKVGLIGVDIENSGLLHSDTALLEDEAVLALVSLGYTTQDAAKALQDVAKELPAEERVTIVLKGSK